MTKKVFYPIILIFLALLALGCSNTQAQTNTSADTSANPLIVRVAFPSVMDIDDIAVLLAIEAMQDEGLAVTPTFYAQSELATAAVASGQADFGFGSSTVWMNAIQKGAPIVGLMKQVANGWSVMAIKDVQSCQDIDGMRVAIHSEGSASVAMFRAYVDQNCPGIEPNYLIIPGSENRAAALLAGEIDVTPSELIDSIRIAAQRPDDFHRMVDFATDLPKLNTTGVWVSTKFAEAHPEVVQSFVRHLLETNRRINQNPEWFVEQVPRFLDMDEADLELLPQIVDALIDIDNYPVDGGLDLEDGQYTLDFFIDSGRLEPGLEAEQVFDLSYLEAAIEEIGPYEQ